MSVENGRTKVVMVSMSSAVFDALERMSQTLGGSRSKIIQQAIISLNDQLGSQKNGSAVEEKEENNAMG